MEGLILAAAGFILTATVIPALFPDLDSDAVSRTSALFIALVGLFTGTIVYMRIYDYVNIRNQMRQWRHEYALRRVEDIYAPLFEQTRGLIRLMQDHSDISSQLHRTKWAGSSEPVQMGFEEIMESHLGLFVDASARTLLQAFHDSSIAYEKAHRDAWTNLYNSASQEITKLTGDKNLSGNASEMMAALTQYSRMIYDPHQTDLEEDARKRFVGAHNMLFHELERAASDFTGIVSRLRELESTKQLRDARARAIPKGESAVVRLKEIIQDPTSVVLDFESS
jgi:hypothetical protein